MPHVAFGGGSHICIGAPLARIEAKQALVRLFQRFPDLKLAGPDDLAGAADGGWRKAGAQRTLIGRARGCGCFDPRDDRQLIGIISA